MRRLLKTESKVESGKQIDVLQSNLGYLNGARTDISMGARASDLPLLGWGQKLPGPLNYCLHDFLCEAEE